MRTFNTTPCAAIAAGPTILETADAIYTQQPRMLVVRSKQMAERRPLEPASEGGASAAAFASAASSAVASSGGVAAIASRRGNSVRISTSVATT